MRYSGGNRDVINQKFDETVERLSCHTKIRKRICDSYKTVVRKFNKFMGQNQIFWSHKLIRQSY